MTRRSGANRSRSNRPNKPEPPPFRVRRGTIRDLATLMRYRLAMQRELGRGVRKGLPAFARVYGRWLAGRIRSHRVIPFILEQGEGGTVGSGLVWIVEDRPHLHDFSVRVPRMHGVYVEPRARRHGAATLLVGEMLAWVRRAGYRRAVLRASPRAETMYYRFGFRRNAEMIREWRE
jgi:GNAT superfamily N-acetyltransferase